MARRALLSAANVAVTVMGIVALLSFTDARRASALMRALGTRSGQVSSGLVVTQALSALPGASVGIPLGYLLFRAAVHHGTLASPLWIAGPVLATVVVMAGLALVPARVGTLQPVTEALQSEAA